MAENGTKMSIGEMVNTHLAPILQQYSGIPRDSPGLSLYKEALTTILRNTKLVIWDLDGTFWKGVIAENTMSYIPRHHHLVVDLTRRGIINSICSNNDPDIARNALRPTEIMDYFVFAKIDWASKAPMISEIISQAQLRPQQVIFLEDNERIREEVMYYNPGVFSTDASFIEHLTFDSWPESDTKVSCASRIYALNYQTPGKTRNVYWNLSIEPTS
jgi:HAD superfamily phosphatase (TIGR01681 family)